MILNYNDYETIIMYSKITDSFLPSEIQGEKGVIEIDKISKPEKMRIKYRDGESEDLSVEHAFDSMYYEAAEFIKTDNNQQIESLINTHYISRIITKLFTK